MIKCCAHCKARVPELIIKWTPILEVAEHTRDKEFLCWDCIRKEKIAMEVQNKLNPPVHGRYY